jgi:hypothetical protein
MFETPEITREMIEQMPEDQRAPWLKHLEQREAGLAERAKLEERREYHRALIFYGSEQRAEALVRWADDLSDDEVRDLLTHNWSTTEAWGGDARLREGMIGLLRRVAPLIVDDEEGRVHPEKGLLEIYRGNAGEDPRLGHSWSLVKTEAQRFARQTTSPRGMFLGMYREDAVPTVWRAFVDARDILGYFNDRNEQEVVVDPETLLEVTKIQEAR